MNIFIDLLIYVLSESSLCRQICMPMVKWSWFVTLPLHTSNYILIHIQSINTNKKWKITMNFWLDRNGWNHFATVLAGCVVPMYLANPTIIARSISTYSCKLLVNAIYEAKSQCSEVRPSPTIHRLWAASIGRASLGLGQTL